MTSKTNRSGDVISQPGCFFAEQAVHTLAHTPRHFGQACISTDTHQRCAHTLSLRFSPAEVWMQSAARRWGQIMFWISERHCWAHLALERSSLSLASCHRAITRLIFSAILATWLVQYLSHSQGHSPKIIVYKAVSSGNTDWLRLAQQD